MTASPAALRALLERLEKAEGENEALDEAIEVWLYPDLLSDATRIDTGWLSPKHGKIRGPEPYTSSLDAAVALAERCGYRSAAPVMVANTMEEMLEIGWDPQQLIACMAKRLCIAIVRAKLAEQPDAR